MKTPELVIADTTADLYRRAAACWEAWAGSAIRARGSFHVALAGGSTPRTLYQHLAQQTRPPIGATHFYFSDERCVPPEHPDSNHRMAREHLLDPLGVPASQVHPMVTEPQRPRLDAHRYAGLLGRLPPHSAAGVPVLDLVMLGLGADGHVASLFPRTCILRDTGRWAAAVYVDRLKAWRISLTLPVINNARAVMVLATGTAKTAVVARALAPVDDGGLLPVQLLQPAGEFVWFLDRDAASGAGC